MRLWHDDIRPAPEGWTWARTNREAQHLLLNEEIEECSLDHDLGMEEVDPAMEGALYLAGHSPDGTGLDLVRWMIENDRVPPKVSIHSWNFDGARRMFKTLADAGHNVKMQRYVHMETVL